jgi:hypothetical protein
MRFQFPQPPTYDDDGFRAHSFVAPDSDTFELNNTFSDQALFLLCGICGLAAGVQR